MNCTDLVAAVTLATLGLMPAQALAETITLGAPMAGVTLHAGGVDMSVYYLDRGERFEVVGTYAGRDGPYRPARLRMALADGERTSFGLPGMATAMLYTFSRAGATVSVEATHVGEELARLAE